jgi:hypothetical protein
MILLPCMHQPALSCTGIYVLMRAAVRFRTKIHSAAAFDVTTLPRRTTQRVVWHHISCALCFASSPPPPTQRMMQRAHTLAPHCLPTGLIMAQAAGQAAAAQQRRQQVTWLPVCSAWFSFLSAAGSCAERTAAIRLSSRFCFRLSNAYVVHAVVIGGLCRSHEYICQ